MSRPAAGLATMPTVVTPADATAVSGKPHAQPPARLGQRRGAPDGVEQRGADRGRRAPLVAGQAGDAAEVPRVGGDVGEELERRLAARAARRRLAGEEAGDPRARAAAVIGA